MHARRTASYEIEGRSDEDPAQTCRDLRREASAQYESLDALPRLDSQLVAGFRTYGGGLAQTTLDVARPQLVPWEAAKLSSCWHGRTLGETRDQLNAWMSLRKGLCTHQSPSLEETQRCGALN
jgi:hypothetical protein